MAVMAGMVGMAVMAGVAELAALNIQDTIIKPVTMEHRLEEYCTAGFCPSL